MTTTTGDVFRPEIWSPEVLRATENALVMANLVKRFDSLVTGKGDVINIPNLSNLTASDKSASTQVTLQAPTETNTTISINKHKESSFLIEDILKVQSNYELMGEYTSKARNHWSCKTISNQWGTSEMTTLNKQAQAVQLQRLNDIGYESSKRQSEPLLN